MKPRIIIRARLAHHVRRLSALATILAAFAFGAHPADAQNVAMSAETAGLFQPLELVRSSVARAVAIVQSQPAGDTENGNRLVEFRHVAGELFDFDDMSRRILAQHWMGATLQERDEFVLLFTGLLERVFMKTIGNYALTTMSFQGESIRDSYAQVWSRMTTEKGRDVSIVYRLFDSEGRWSVDDVVVDGVSLVSSYRSQFDSILRRSTFGQLLDGMQSRKAQVVSRRRQ